MKINEIKGISYSKDYLNIKIDGKLFEITPAQAFEITETLIDYLGLPYKSIEFIEDEMKGGNNE